MNGKKIGIVARTKEMAEQHAAELYWPSEIWVYIPLSDTLSGREFTHTIFDELEDVEAPAASMTECKHRWEEINFPYRHPTHYMYRCARCSAFTFTFLKGKK